MDELPSNPQLVTAPAKELKMVAGRRSLSPRESQRLSRRTEENLTPRMKAMRDRFIAEFLVDWSGPNAYIRAGGPASTAAKMASEYLREPYVTKKIYEVLESMEEAEIISRKKVLAGLIREAHYQGIGASHGARVSAWSKLANILGMEQVNVRVEGNVDHNVRGGVMVVPVVPGTDAWEQLASNTQKQLKEDVRK
jgi:phage terminase small subunit